MNALQIEEQAARYLARLQQPGWSASDQTEFDAWLDESTAHEVAYLRLEFGWRKTERLSVLRNPAPPALETGPDAAARVALLEPASAPRSRMRIRMAWGTAAVLFLLTVAAGLWHAGVLERRAYATEIGGHEVVPLADGSRVELNTDTEIRVDIASTHRTVWVERGEAYFDVARDASRPFNVYAGTRRIVVLGTRFSVRFEPQVDRLRLAVSEGSVKLEPVKARAPTPPVFAKGGDRVIAEGDATVLEPHVVAESPLAFSWRRGTLIFDQTTLGEAAAEFNRYNRKKLIVDPASAGTRIGGSFEATNVEAFLRLLNHGFGLSVEEVDGEIRISERGT